MEPTDIDAWIAAKYPVGAHVVIEDMSKLKVDQYGEQEHYWLIHPRQSAYVMSACRDGLLLSIAHMFQTYITFPTWPVFVYTWVGHGEE